MEYKFAASLLDIRAISKSITVLENNENKSMLINPVNKPAI